jgi:hypothetical protein
MASPIPWSISIAVSWIYRNLTPEAVLIGKAAAETMLVDSVERIDAIIGFLCPNASYRLIHIIGSLTPKLSDSLFNTLHDENYYFYIYSGTLPKMLVCMLNYGTLLWYDPNQL